MPGLIAADSKAVCANELLECAAILFERLESFDDPDITTINRLTIKERAREAEPHDLPA